MKFDHLIVGEIDMELAHGVCEKLLMKAPKKEINIFLSSQGGDVDGTLSLGSAIQCVRRQGAKVHIHVGGIAHSSGALLLQFANRRTMESYATIRLHPLWASYPKQNLSISDLHGELDAMSYAHYIYYEVLQRRSGRNIENDLTAKQHHLRQDFLLLPHQCLEWGLIDEIIDYNIPSADEESHPPLFAARSVADIRSHAQTPRSRNRRKAS
jgi:ATP-dependent protease ClpP protease subunit